MAPIRMAHTVASLEPRHGGPSRSVPALAAALREQDVDATVHALDACEWPSERSDLIHDHGIWLPANHRVARIASRSGTPRVVSVRGMLEPWARNHGRWKKRLAWHLYQRRDLVTAALIHVTCEREAGSVRWAGLRNPLAVIPNGTVIPDLLPPRPPGGRRQALFLSRIHPKKGLPMLLEAWDRFRPEEWDLVIAGPDEHGHRRELEATVGEWGMAGEVRFTGPVTDAEKWFLYRGADLFVLPTHSENFGIVVAEALAAGVPVITTEGAPWKELATERCGWWTEIGAEPLEEALREAVALSDAERVAMGRRGRTLVQERYGWPKVAERMRDVYAWVLGGGAPPSCVRFFD